MKKPTDFAYYLTKFLTNHLPAVIGGSPNTIFAYRDSFVLLIRYYSEVRGIDIQKLEISKFSRELIEGFLDWLEKGRGCSVSTRNQRLAAIHAFFKYMQLEEPTQLHLYQQILAIPRKRIAAPLINYLSKEGIEALLKAPDAKTLHGRRDTVLLSLMYDSGARSQEMADLRVSDLRLAVPTTVKLTGKGGKGRIVPLMKPTAELLQRYFKEQRLDHPSKSAYPLFPNRSGQKLTRFGIRYILSKYVKQVQASHPGLIPDVVFPHSIRHSRAVHLLQDGVELVYIRDLLGHSSIEVTEVYAKTDSLMKRKALEAAYEKGTITPSLPSWQQDGELLAWLRNLGK
jgi:site-specific recombinase XerD